MRRVGLPPEFLRVVPGAFASASLVLPSDWLPRGRWRIGFGLHSFTDDYRQEFAWRRPVEGAMVALAAEAVTAPDFSVYDDDPDEWARYQVWRSAVVAGYWASLGVQVLPVVAFRGQPWRYVPAGSVWAVRGPGRVADRADWISRLLDFASHAKPSRVVVFGRAVEVPGLDVQRVALVSSKWAAAQKEGKKNGR